MSDYLCSTNKKGTVAGRYISKLMHGVTHDITLMGSRPEMDRSLSVSV